MRPALIPLLLLLAAIAAAAWCMWPESAGEPVTEIGGSPAAPRDAAAPLAGDAAPAREPVAPEPSDAAVLVRVVGTDGTPVGGAEVLHTLPAGPPETAAAEAQRLWERDRAAWAARFGVALRSDARGCARIAVPTLPESPWGNAMYVCARHAGEFADDWVRWEQAAGAEITLRLTLDIELVAKLIDAAGHPVPGVPLAARFHRVDELIGLHRAVRALGTTDADGLVRSPHVQSWWGAVHAPDGLRHGVIGPSVAGLDAAGTEVVLERMPAAPVLVHMPPTGRVVVEVKGWREPSPGHWRPSIEMRPADDAAVAGDVASYDAEIDEAGRAVFARVALGRTWKARLTPSMRSSTFEGPRHDGEEVVLRIEAPSRPFLTGRLLRDARPLRRTAFHLVAKAGERSLRASGRTDDEGRFRLERYPPEIRVTIEDVRCAVVQAGAADALAGSIAGARELAAGDNELGDLVLAGVPPILTGRIAGEPDGNRTRLWVEAAAARGEFRPVETVSVEILPDGAFAARGIAPRAPLRLAVFSPPHVPVPPIPFAAGRRDLVVTLRAGGSVVAEVVAGDQRAHLTVAARIVPIDGRTSDSLVSIPWARGIHEYDRAIPARPEPVETEPWTCRYTWSGLPPGRYSVELRAWGSYQPALEISDVVVPDGGSVELERIDLRDRLVQVTLRFPDLEGGARLEAAMAEGRMSLGHVFVEGPEGLSAECYAIDSHFVFVAGSGPLDLVIDVPGFARKVLRGVRDDTEVHLEPGLPVELTLATQPDLPDGAALVVQLAPGQGTALPSGGHVLSPAAGGSIPNYAPPPMTCRREGAVLRASVTAPGTYDLWAATRLVTGRTVPMTVAPARIQVGRTGATATITVTEQR